jgi:hypothetical protein
LIDDPSNRRERLIVFRIDECEPTGFLKRIRYIDLVPCLHCPETLAKTIVDAVSHVAGERTPAAIGKGDAIENLKSPPTEADFRNQNVDRLILFLENEDEKNTERKYNLMFGAVLVIAAALIACELFIDWWNTLFETSHVVIFDSGGVIFCTIISFAVLFFGAYTQVRDWAKAIENAVLSVRQLRAFRSRVKAMQWKSKSLINGAVWMAVRNITHKDKSLVRWQ